MTPPMHRLIMFSLYGLNTLNFLQKTLLLIFNNNALRHIFLMKIFYSHIIFLTLPRAPPLLNPIYDNVRLCSLHQESSDVSVAFHETEL